MVSFLCQVDKLPDVYVNELHTEFFLHGVFVGLACDEPVGRLPDDAEFLSPKFLPCTAHPCEGLNPPGDVLCTSVQDLAPSAVLVQERQNF